MHRFSCISKLRFGTAGGVAIPWHGVLIIVTSGEMDMGKWMKRVFLHLERILSTIR